MTTIFIGFALAFALGGVIGWLLGLLNITTDDETFHNGIKTFMKGPEIKPIDHPKIDKEKMHIWDIVRYKDNGEYDCVWSSGHTKREADKRCAKLNSDYHRYYGKYVVEDGVYKDRN